jgi:hypothetical protein
VNHPTRAHPGHKGTVIPRRLSRSRSTDSSQERIPRTRPQNPDNATGERVICCQFIIVVSEITATYGDDRLPD